MIRSVHRRSGPRDLIHKSPYRASYYKRGANRLTEPPFGPRSSHSVSRSYAAMVVAVVTGLSSHNGCNLLRNPSRPYGFATWAEHASLTAYKAFSALALLSSRFKGP